jgi:hypothetical protein
MQTIKKILVLSLVLFAVGKLTAQSTTWETKKYKALELSVSDCLNFQAEAKLGIRPIYGVFGIGNQFIYEDYQWAFGLGLGTHLLKQEKQSINLEYMYYHVNQNELWTDQMNSLQQMKFIYSRRIGEIVSVFGGPVFNLNISDNEESSGRPFNSTFPPYDMFTNQSSSHTTVGWIGFTLGLRFDR